MVTTLDPVDEETFFIRFRSVTAEVGPALGLLRNELKQLYPPAEVEQNDGRIIVHFDKSQRTSVACLIPRCGFMITV